MDGRLFFTLFLILSAHLIRAQQWQLKKDKDGIKVYTAESESGYDMFKAEMAVKGSIDGLVLLVKDVDRAPEWMEDVDKVEMIREASDLEWITWTGIGMPWPVEDRDVVTILRIEQQGVICKILISSKPDLLPLREDFIRLNQAEGYWAFEQLKDGQVKVTYEFESDPEGIPAWIVNLFLVESPFNTLKNMREKLKSDPYRTASLNYLR